GSYSPIISTGFNIITAVFNAAYYTRTHKSLRIHGSISIAANTSNDTAYIIFNVPVIDSFSSEYQANGIGMPQALGGQESHPARIIALENDKVKMSWWSVTTDSVKWSIILEIFDTGTI